MTRSDASFEALLDFLKRSRGIDFTGYKRTSLERRFRRRLETVACPSFGDYLDFLEVHPEEYEALFDTLLINVTAFFRDPPAWDALRGEIMPRVIDDKPPDEPVRVWCAGCSSGQEPYTVAMVLAEVLGLETYRRRVKIYATDIDEQALEQARQGAYSTKEVEGVADELRDRYFERSGSRLAFRKDLRRTVIFGRNNLVADAPISRLDLLVCRNTLMYFNAETQSRILRHFHFALRDGGVLLLGRSEMMIAHRDLFEAVDMKQRVFCRARRSTTPLQLRVADIGNAEQTEIELAEDERLSRDAAMELGPNPQVIVSRAGLLTFANLPARALFKLSLDDLGRPFQDLELSYRPIELRQPIEEALRERRRVAVGAVTHRPEQGSERELDISVVPLLAGSGPALGASVLFEDVTRFIALQRNLESHQHELEQAYEELQSTIDELETTNEELQSANEELQTTNEELQSTNEELETMNEELQSSNEELETMNDELRDRTGELNDVNEFFQAVLTSLALAVVVVDREQRVQVWNDRSEALWGLRTDEVADHSFLSLEIGLPTERLAPALRSVVAGASPRERVELEAVNRRGKSISCTATVLPLRGLGEDGHPRGAIVLIEDGALDGAPRPGA